MNRQKSTKESRMMNGIDVCSVGDTNLLFNNNQNYSLANSYSIRINALFNTCNTTDFQFGIAFFFCCCFSLFCCLILSLIRHHPKKLTTNTEQRVPSSMRRLCLFFHCICFRLLFILMQYLMLAQRPD